MARSTPDPTRLRAAKPWRATYTPALTVTAGQKVRPGRKDDAFPGWQWVASETGLGGWIPAALVTSETVASGFDTTELTVCPGDLLVQLETCLGWTRCRAGDGREGWVPDTCLAADQAAMPPRAIAPPD